MYLFFLVLSAMMGTSLNKDIEKLLEEKGYVDKSRIERVKRVASGNIVEYKFTKEDVIIWLKKNIWYFLPIWHVIYILAFYFRYFIYEGKAQDFFGNYLDFLIENDDAIIACSEDKIKHIHEIEEELATLKKEKRKEFLEKIGIEFNFVEVEEDVDDDLEEEQDEDLEDNLDDFMDDEIEEEQDVEDDLEKSDGTSIKIKICTPLGNKTFYRVIGAHKKENDDNFSKEKESEEITKNLNNAEKDFYQSMDENEQEMNLRMDEVNQSFDEIDAQLDGSGDEGDLEMDEVDQILDEIDEMFEKRLKL